MFLSQKKISFSTAAKDATPIVILKLHEKNLKKT
jgi:hypothetical protein